jgi:hypothetical protein
VQQDWAAVARAIDTRLAELNWRQRELAERAQVSVVILRECIATPPSAAVVPARSKRSRLRWAGTPSTSTPCCVVTPPRSRPAGDLAGGPGYSPADLDRPALGCHRTAPG